MPELSYEALTMPHYKPWTQDEEDYLEDSWGTVSLKTIARNLGRSEGAIKIKKGKLGLGAFLDGGEYITFNQLSIALGRNTADNYMLISWVKNRDFPLKYKRVNENRFRVVYLDDFWKWAQ